MQQRIWNLKSKIIALIGICAGLTSCGNEGGSSSNLSSAKASMQSTASTLFPVAGEYIDSSVAKKYIGQYGKTINVNGESTKFVLFRTDNLIKALQGYCDNGGEYTRVYLGVDSLNYVYQNQRYTRLTVFFQPAREDSNRGVEDLPFTKESPLTMPYNLGIICPPPKCGGRSNYYGTL